VAIASAQSERTVHPATTTTKPGMADGRFAGCEKSPMTTMYCRFPATAPGAIVLGEHGIAESGRRSCAGARERRRDPDVFPGLPTRPGYLRAAFGGELYPPTDSNTGRSRAKSGAFTFSLDNAFLYNDGDKLGSDLCTHQLSGAAGGPERQIPQTTTHMERLGSAGIRSRTATPSWCNTTQGISL